MRETAREKEREQERVRENDGTKMAAHPWGSFLDEVSHTKKRK